MIKEREMEEDEKRQRELGGKLARLWEKAVDEMAAIRESKGMMDQGAGLEERGGSGFTPMEICARKDWVEGMKFLAKSGARVESSKEMALLEMALGSGSQGQLKTARWLVEQGVPVEGKRRTGESWLMAAAMGADAELVRAMIARGARWDLSAGGLTAMSFAARRGGVEVMEELWAAGARPRPEPEGDLSEAIHHGRGSAARWLIKRGASVRWKERDGETALALVEALHMCRMRKAEWEELCAAQGEVSLMEATQVGEAVGRVVSEKDEEAVEAALGWIDRMSDETVRLVILTVALGFAGGVEFEKEGPRASETKKLRRKVEALLERKQLGLEAKASAEEKGKPGPRI